MRGKAQPVLDAGAVLLRPWEPKDVPAVVEAYADPGIQQWNLQVVDREEAVAWVARWGANWRSESDACWAAVDLADPGNVLGRITLRNIQLAVGSAELTYWVLPAARDRGVAAAAARAVARWAFGDLGLHRLELHHSVRNSASCRVADKAGFQLEGTAPQRSAPPRRVARHAPPRPSRQRPVK